MNNTQPKDVQWVGGLQREELRNFIDKAIHSEQDFTDWAYFNFHQESNPAAFEQIQKARKALAHARDYMRNALAEMP